METPYEDGVGHFVIFFPFLMNTFNFLHKVSQNRHLSWWGGIALEQLLFMQKKSRLWVWGWGVRQAPVSPLLRADGRVASV